MYKKIIFSIASLIYPAIVFSQSPDLYPPTVPDTVDVNLFNIILYIVLPIALVAAFFWYQRSQKKKRQQNLKEKEKQSGNKRSKN